jgi:hypothetical protein
MTFPKARLAVSACLFVGWLLFLFSVWLRSNPVVLSKPQFLIAQLYAVVEVQDDNGKANPEVFVEEVLWAANTMDETLARKKIRLADLPTLTEQQGYKGAGLYLVPLLKSAESSFMIAPIPRGESRVPRIYWWTPVLRSQVDEFIAAKH